MSRFDRYLLTQLLALFGFFSLVLVAVYWVNRAVGLFDDLIGDGQSALVFLQISALTLPNVIRLVLPISAFVASVYAANRLMSESELVVMQATGFSAFRLARPVVYFGLLVAAMLLVLMHYLVPASRTALQERSAEIAQNTTSRFLKDGQFLHPSDGITVYIREISANGELQDLFLADDRDRTQHTTYTARKALFARNDVGPKLLMFDGIAQVLDTASGHLTVTRFRDFTYDLSGLMVPPKQRTPRIDELLTTDLLAAPDALLVETGQTRAAFLFEAHSRFAQPFMATAAALIGFSALLLGSFSRFGLWRQIIIAIALLLVVQAVATFTASVGANSDSNWPLAYVAPIFGIGLGLGALWLSQRPRRVGPIGVVAP